MQLLEKIAHALGFTETFLGLMSASMRFLWATLLAFIVCMPLILLLIYIEHVLLAP